MNKDQISAFTSRITQSNKSELICVLYEVFFAYMEETKSLDILDARESYRNASQVLQHLKKSLNFKYEISNQLFSLYDYCERVLAKGMYMGRTSEVEAAENIMKELHEAFIEVAKDDKSDSVMKNAQKLTAGLTYGKNDLNEATANFDSNRGFLA